MARVKRFKCHGAREDPCRDNDPVLSASNFSDRASDGVQIIFRMKRGSSVQVRATPKRGSFRSTRRVKCTSSAPALELPS